MQIQSLHPLLLVSLLMTALLFIMGLALYSSPDTADISSTNQPPVSPGNPALGVPGTQTEQFSQSRTSKEAPSFSTQSHNTLQDQRSPELEASEYALRTELDGATAPILYVSSRDYNSSSQSIYRVLAVNLRNHSAVEIAILPVKPATVGFNDSKGQLLFAMDDIIYMQDALSEAHVILDTASVASDAGHLLGFAASPRGKHLVLSLKREPFGSSSLFLYEVGQQTHPILITSFEDPVGIAAFPYLWDAADTIYVQVSAAKGFGQTALLIDPNGAEREDTLPYEVDISRVWPTDLGKRYFLTTAALDDSPLILEGQDGKLGQGLIQLYDVIQRKANVLAAEAKRHFVPMAVSVRGDYALYQAWDLADCFWDWPAETWCSYDDAGAMGNRSYILVNLQSKAKEEFHSIEDLSGALQNRKLDDYIFYRAGSSLWLNGDVLLKLRTNADPVHFFSRDPTDLNLLGLQAPPSD